MLTFIIIVVVLIIGKFVYDSYLTNNTERNWKEFKKIDPERAARIENSTFGAKPIKQDQELLSKKKDELILAKMKFEFNNYVGEHLEKVEDDNPEISKDSIGIYKITYLYEALSDINIEFSDRLKELNISENEFKVLLNEIAQERLEKINVIYPSNTMMDYEERPKIVKLINALYNDSNDINQELIEQSKDKQPQTLDSEITNFLKKKISQNESNYGDFSAHEILTDKIGLLREGLNYVQTDLMDKLMDKYNIKKIDFIEKVREVQNDLSNKIYDEFNEDIIYNKIDLDVSREECLSVANNRRLINEEGIYEDVEVDEIVRVKSTPEDLFSNDQFVGQWIIYFNAANIYFRQKAKECFQKGEYHEALKQRLFYVVDESKIDYYKSHKKFNLEVTAQEAEFTPNEIDYFINRVFRP